MSAVNAILAISYRDLLKLLRDPVRIASTFVFPLVFIGVLGGALQANLGASVGYNFLTFTFTGVLAQTLFQSAATGVISLIEDRENDFSQEIFVAPISRYAIVFGKILGESLVALPQGFAIIIFAYLIAIPISPAQLLGILIVSVAVCFYGGAFGLMMLASLNSRRAANEVFPFILLPQYFLAGIFAPIQVLPFYLEIFSRLSPMRYAVDLTRISFYLGQPDYAKVVLDGPILDAVVMTSSFAAFLALGTWLFVRGERNR